LSICVRVKEFGNGQKMVSSKLGDRTYEVAQVNGSKFEGKLKEFKYVP
jgi:hypothetical protein